MAQKIIKIALFEDDREDVFYLKELLKETYEVKYIFHEYKTLAAGLNNFNCKDYSIIITDLNLPDSNGFATFNELFRKCQRVPIIVLTAQNDQDLGILCVQNGAQDFLNKGTVDDITLIKAIQYAIERNQMVNTLEEQRIALEESEARLNTIVSNSPDITLSLNRHGEILFINGKSLKGKNQNFIGKKIYPFVDKNERQKLKKIINKIFGIQKLIKTEVKGKGGKIWEVRFAHIHSEASVLAVARDVTDQKHLENKLSKIRNHEKFLAYHDYLTKLPNRHLFFDRLGQALINAKRYNHEFAILFVDLDGFKNINDSYGHQVGDFALQVIASRLKSALRESDTVSRIGGDEFVIIARQLSDFNHASHIADKLLKAISVPIHYEKSLLKLGCSIGISLFPFDGKTTDELVTKADTAMYRAKSVGKDCYCYFNSEIDKTSFEQSQLADGLQTAISKNELVAYYQPQVNLKTNEITGLEALVRWNHPTKGFLMPGEFLGMAEKNNLVDQIDMWMIENVCSQMSTWSNQGLDDIEVSINLNANIISKEHLSQILERNVTKNNINPENICLEITENHLIHDIEGTLDGMISLKENGYKLAIDDFGTGYSSLSYLSKFPVDYLKIDKSFLTNFNKSHDNAAITSAIIGLGKNMQLDVIAEGVETEEQVEFLRSHNCDIIQGYLISEPVPAKSVQAQFIAQPA